MNIYLIKDGQNSGPYSESEVMARVQDGRYSKTDLALCEGCDEPMPLIEILCSISGSEPLGSNPALVADELRPIAENYSKLFLVAACWLVFCFLPVSGALEHICYLVIFGAWMRFGWRLSRALQRNQWLWVIMTLIPLANIYALVQILRAAAKVLKSKGIVPTPWIGFIAPAPAQPESHCQPRSLWD